MPLCARNITERQRPLGAVVGLIIAMLVAAPVVADDPPTKAKKPIRVRIVDDSPTTLPTPQPVPLNADAPPDTPPEEPLPATPTPAVRNQGSPTPARREPRLATRPDGTIPERPAPPPPAPVAERPVESRIKRPANDPPANPAATTNAARPAKKPQTTSDKITIDDVYPASFQDVTPGDSTLADAIDAFGKPIRESKKGSSSTYSFQVDPFPKTSVVVKKDVVVSVEVQLEAPTPARDVAEELELTRFSHTLLLNEDGQQAGRYYPERGVTLRYAPGKAREVDTILVEDVSVDGFLLRVRNDRQHRYRQNMLDLELAQQLNPKDARPHWWRAKLLAAQGRPLEATAAVQEAVRLDPKNARYQLTKATLLGSVGQVTRAITETRTVLNREDLSSAARAIGECQLGMLLGLGTSRDPKQAATHQTVAIEAASKLLNAESWEERREAKEVLLDAHLGMASNVAWGNWKSKREVVGRWMANAKAIAQELIDSEDGDPAVQLRYYRTALSVGIALGDDPSKVTQQAIDVGRQLIADASDPIYKLQLEWELGDTLCLAVTASKLKGQFDEAIVYGNNASVLIENAVDQREQTMMLDYFLGTFYYTIGSVHSTGKNDHLAAVRAYEKAVPHFANLTIDANFVDAGSHGERLVSMGVSYWQTGSQDQGIQLTNDGAQWIAQSVRAGTSAEKALAVPYGNLANMYQQLGNKSEAQSFQQMAAKFEKSTK